MSIVRQVKKDDKTYLVKSVLTRKIRRQLMKNRLGTNRIGPAWRRERE